MTRVCRENGEWSSVVSGEGCYCEPTVVEERGTYIFARTEPLATVVKACTAMYTSTIRYTCSLGGSWTDLVKECERITCPGETMEGECSCPAEVVHHSDGNMYLMEESGERDVRREHVRVMCRGRGVLYGRWSAIRSECKHVQACASMCKHVQACASMCKHVQAHSVSGGAAERLHVAGDEQFDGGACAVQRVHDGLRVAHVRSDGRVERA